MRRNRLPGKTLTVVFRDDTPLVCCNDAPTYRSVRIQLTELQRTMLAMQYTGTSGGVAQYEAISRCFIEPDEEEN